MYTDGEKKEAQRVLHAKVSPKKATVKNIIYKAADETIVSVSKKGVVTAKKEGKTKITAYAADGWGKKAVCEVTAKKKAYPTAAPETPSTPSSSVTALPSGETEAPTPTVKPERGLCAGAIRQSTAAVPGCRRR